MTWFDFFNHDSARVMRNMEAWMTQVVPLIERGFGENFMTIQHDPHSAVSPGQPGSQVYPASPLGEDIQGIPTGRDVEWNLW